MKKNLMPIPYLSSLCMSLKLIIKAGIPISEGFLMLSEDERDLGRKTLLKDIYRQLDTGEPLYISMKSTGAFPKYMTDMVEIGERTGKLEDVFGSLTGYYVQQEQISKNIKNAVLYPAILLIIMLFVIIVLVTEILPVFHDVYTQLGSTMPAAATAIMNFGIALSQYWYIFGILLVLIAAVFLTYRCVPSFKNRLSRLFSGRAVQKTIGYTRFASAMAMALSSGMDTDEAMDMARRLNSDTAMAGKIETCRELMQGGKGLSEAISAAGILPPLYCRMLTIGMKAGSADTVMAEIASRGEEEVNDRISSIVGKVEPTLVIIMSVIVGLILLTVMLPLVNIMSTIG